MNETCYFLGHVKQKCIQTCTKRTDSDHPAQNIILDLISGTLQKHACSNILKILQSKKENFQIKNSGVFHISSQNIDCGYSLEPPRRGGFNEYPQSIFLSRNKKNNVIPYKPQFYYIKVGFKGLKII